MMIMKKNLLIAAGLILALSCGKDKSVPTEKPTEGTLSFSSFSLECDETLDTRASVAGGNYSVFIYDTEGKLCKSSTYSEVKSSASGLTLPSGQYTLVARSQSEDVPVAAFEQPVYGASSQFQITAGQTTNAPALTCTLLQCKVTVSYNDDFLNSVTGNGTATVTVTEGHPLEFAMNYSGGNAAYDQTAGYFAINGNSTMEVTFKGNIDGKSQKMTKVFTGITAKQWRQIRFVKKTDETGNASFDITINPYVEDEDLNNQMSVAETVIGDDPKAPKGDGGITLAFDYTNGCDSQFTDLMAMKIPAVTDRTMKLIFSVDVPNGIKKFLVNISSTSESFTTAVAAADATTLNLISPSEASMIVFEIVPFPYGSALLGQTHLSLDLSASQEAIVMFPGEHTFSLDITDNSGCKKSIPLKMIVE